MWGRGIAYGCTGSACNIYVTGSTVSTDFPTTGTAFESAIGTTSQGAFLSVLAWNGTTLSNTYSTCLGGLFQNDFGFGAYDGGTAVAVDGNGNAYVTGITYSPDSFPTTSNALSSAYFGNLAYAALYGNTFVTEIDPFCVRCGGLIYFTFFGGGSTCSGPPLSCANYPNASAGIGDQANGIAVDTAATPNIYVAGITYSADFPTVNYCPEPSITAPPAPPPAAPIVMPPIAARGLWLKSRRELRPRFIPRTWGARLTPAPPGVIPPRESLLTARATPMWQGTPGRQTSTSSKT